MEYVFLCSYSPYSPFKRLYEPDKIWDSGVFDEDVFRTLPNIYGEGFCKHS